MFSQRYLPRFLSKRDTQKQKRGLLRARTQYKRGKYVNRPYLKSFHSHPSKHVATAKRMYHIDKITPSIKLAKKTKCTRKALYQIVKKGRGAYYSSGSRPNQTADSWAMARLASAITGANASRVDYHILKDGCQQNSPALKMAQKPKNA
jgi:hypothetical protein